MINYNRQARWIELPDFICNSGGYWGTIERKLYESGCSWSTMRWRPNGTYRVHWSGDFHDHDFDTLLLMINVMAKGP